MRPHEHQNVPGHGHGAERQQRAALSPPVRKPAAGIGVDRAKKSLQRVEQTDDENTAAKRFDVFGRKAEPELFPRAREHERDEQQRRVPPQREEF